MSLTLIGGSVSPFVRKVRVFCAEKNIAYDLEPVNPFAAPEGFRDISPLGRIPVLLYLSFFNPNGPTCNLER